MLLFQTPRFSLSHMLTKRSFHACSLVHASVKVPGAAPRPPIPFPLTGRPDFSVDTFDFDRERAIAADQNSSSPIRIYTDGSLQMPPGEAKKAGAAAVLLRDGRAPRGLRHCFPHTSTVDILAAELAGMICGLELLLKEQNNSKSCALVCDSQAALLAILQTSRTQRHPLAEEFIKQASFLSAMHGSSYSLDVLWTPGHKNVRGNVMADREAYNAAMGLANPPRSIPTCLRDDLLVSRPNVASLPGKPTPTTSKASAQLEEPKTC